MTENQLLNKELLNLYALCKQIQEVFNTINFDSIESGLLLHDISKANTIDFEMLTEIIHKLELNPGNTKDSVIEQILENIEQISKMELKDRVKLKGLLASVNRLLHYKIANLENIQKLGLHITSNKISESLDISRNYQEELMSITFN